MSIPFYVPPSRVLPGPFRLQRGLRGQKFILGTQNIYTLATNSVEKWRMFTIHPRSVHRPFKNFLIFLKKGLAKCLKLW